jgi:DNA polymerase III delta prime subunit
MVWITEVENAQSWEEFEDDEEFYTLSANIAAGLIIIMYCDLGRRITILDDQLSRKGEMLNGRQILWLVYQRFRVHKTQAAMLTREHLFAIKLNNDNLREFPNSWDEVMLEMTDEVDEGTLAMQFRKGIDQATIMKDYLRQYDMNRFNTGEENSYRDLYNLSQRIMDGSSCC